MRNTEHDFEDPNLPLYPGTLRGYRWWTFEREQLRSISIWTHYWSEPVISADCRFLFSGMFNDSTLKNDHHAPWRDCDCGIYAFYDPAYNDRKYLKVKTSDFVFGMISAWGKIIPGTRGFKAEKAKIEAVVLPAKKAETVKHQHPHLRLFGSKKELLAAYPPQEVEWSK